MKKSARILTALLAAVMLLTLSACGGSSGGNTASSAGTSASASGEALKTVTGGTLTMATNAEFPPYEFHENDKISGIDADIAAAIAKKLNLKLNITDMDFTAVVAAVQTGKADIAMAGLTVTDDRKQQVDFTTSYATGIQAIIVKSGSPIATVDDLSKGGYKIGVQESTTGDIYTTSDLGDKELATISRFNKGADAVQALISGKVDCVVIDNEPAKSFVAANQGLKILDSKYKEEQYAIGYSKNNQALGKAVDTALQQLIADGTVKSIINKYISAS